MLLPIQTTVELAPDVAREILNVAVRGGCEGWAETLGLERDALNSHLCVRASIIARDGSLSGVVGIDDVVRGIGRLLANPDTPVAIRRLMLRVVVDNDGGAVCGDLAGHVVREALTH